MIASTLAWMLLLAPPTDGETDSCEHGLVAIEVGRAEAPGDGLSRSQMVWANQRLVWFVAENDPTAEMSPSEKKTPKTPFGLRLRERELEGKGLKSEIIVLARNFRDLSAVSDGEYVTVGGIGSKEVFRGESQVEVLRVDSSGRIVWHQAIGAPSSILKAKVRLATTRAGILAIWEENRFPSSAILSVLLDPKSGAPSRVKSIAELAEGSFMDVVMTGEGDGALAAWYASNPDEKARGLFVARLSAEGVRKSTRRIAADAGVGDLAIVAASEGSLVLFDANRTSEHTPTLQGALLDESLSVRKLHDFQAEPLGAVMAAWSKGRFVVSWSTAPRSGGKSDVWATTLGLDGRVTSHVSLTGGLGGFGGELIGVDGQVFSTHPNPSLGDAHAVSRLDCGDGKEQPRRHRDPCGLERRDFRDRFENRVNALWALAPASEDRWAILRAESGLSRLEVRFADFEGRIVARDVDLGSVQVGHSLGFAQTKSGFAVGFRDIEQAVWIQHLDESGSAAGPAFKVSAHGASDFGGPCLGSDGSATWAAWASGGVPPTMTVATLRARDTVGRRTVVIPEGPMRCTFVTDPGNLALLTSHPLAEAPNAFVRALSTIEAGSPGLHDVLLTSESVHAIGGFEDGLAIITSIQPEALSVSWVSTNREVTSGQLSFANGASRFLASAVRESPNKVHELAAFDDAAVYVQGMCRSTLQSGGLR
ncbi:MAG: hypothetical protein HY791_05455 [Deltaproteobacteria bacterium]|nr:hypothetical protein [Deltaproteobacteria bacterium]